MSKNKELKEQIVVEITEKIKNSKSFVVVDYKGITVKQDTALRSACRGESIDYKVYKNRYMKIALNNLGYTEFDEALNGTTAIAFANSDPLVASKVITQKCEEFKKISCKCGMLDKKYIDATIVTALAKIPSREILLGQLVGLLQSPIRSLAVAVKAVADKN